MNDLVGTRPKSRLSPMEIVPLLSIVVTSYTEKRLEDLFDLIESVKLQSYPNTETIVVIERASELYHKLKSRIIEGEKTVIVFSLNELGISGARNLGVKHAKGDIVAFVDDDAVLSPKWAEAIVNKLAQNTDVVGVTGPILPLWEDKSLAWFPQEFYWLIGCTISKYTTIVEVEYAPGTNMAFRSEVFRVASFRNIYTKGAHEEGKLGPVGDDREFSLTVRKNTGGSIFYSPDIRVFHKVNCYKFTSKFIRRYAFWQGYSEAIFMGPLRDVHGRFGVQHRLLQRTIFKLFPSVLKEATLNTEIALRKLKMLAEILLYFSLGFFSYVIPKLIRITKRFV